MWLTLAEAQMFVGGQVELYDPLYEITRRGQISSIRPQRKHTGGGDWHTEYELSLEWLVEFDSFSKWTECEQKSVTLSKKEYRLMKRNIRFILFNSNTPLTLRGGVTAEATLTLFPPTARLMQKPV